MFRYDEGICEERELTNLTEIENQLQQPGVVWVDVCGLGSEATFRQIGEIFSLHALALEDVVNVPQRPKIESYDEHLLLITRMITMKEVTVLDAEQVSIFVGSNYVLTVQERTGDVFDPVRQRIRRGGGPIRKHGPDYLAYALLDVVIDAYYPILERLGDFLEELEDEIIQRPTVASLQRVYRIKRELLTLRRSVWPQRESINALVRDDLNFIGDAVRIYLRDTYDHCIQIIDVTESYRELVSGLMDVYLSSVGNRQNEVMKVLTIMASIFIPLTFLAGVYGMNFENMPELHAPWSYPAVLVTMLAVAIGMIIYFRRKGWLGEREDSD